MFVRLFIFVCFSFCSFVPSSLYLSAHARDLIRGPLVLSLSDKWTVSEEAGPELLKAGLTGTPTATLSVWKYKPGSMPAQQFLAGLRADLGWTVVNSQNILDSRFGRTNVGLYKKSGAYEEVQFKIRSYDFVLDGDIYVLEMRAPQAQFDKSDPEFRAVFAALANLSGAVGGSRLEKNEGDGRRMTEPVVEITSSSVSSSPPSVLLQSPSSSVSPPPASFSPPSPPAYTLIYELPDGSRLGFDMQRNMATLHTRAGQIKSVFPVSGTPFLTQDAIYLLTYEYAYKIDPLTGNISARLMSQEVLQGRRAPVSDVPPSVPSSPGEASPTVQSSPAIPSLAGSDYLKAAIDRASQIRRKQGVKPAIDYLMGEKPAAEQSHSPHLYEFYFRLGEYWEETGDLETALAYYRLATKAID